MLQLVKVDSKRGLSLIQVPEPRITRKDEVLVEVGACGICGSDLKAYLSDEHMLAHRIKSGWPLILGHEIGGTVREVGKDVTGFKEGDRVICNSVPSCGFCFYCIRGQTNLCINKGKVGLGHSRVGGFTKYIVVTPVYLFQLPGDIPVEEAALVEPLGVAVRAIERSHIKPGDSAVIIGPGPLGILATMLLKSAGIQPLIVVGRETSGERLKIATEIGAITLMATDDHIQEEIKSLSTGLGVDVVFDFTGDSKAMGNAIKFVRDGGEILIAGGGTEGGFDQHQVVVKELTILAFAQLQSSTWQRAINLVVSRSMDLRKVITHTLPLEDYERAFNLLLERKALKVILIP